MFTTYADDDLTFRAPSGFRVRKLGKGHCCLTRGKTVADIALWDQTQFEIALAQMEATPQFLPYASPLVHEQIGSNHCYIQTCARTLPDSQVYTQLRVLITSRSEYFSVVIEGTANIELDEFRELLASLSTNSESDEAPGEGEHVRLAAAMGSNLGSQGHGSGTVDDPPHEIAATRVKVAQLVVFAENYQFCLYDTSRDPFSKMPKFGEKEFRKGWTKSGTAIWYFTKAHGNRHMVEIFTGKSFVADKSADRTIAINLHLPKGECAILQHEVDCTIRVNPGSYTIYFSAFNCGMESSEDGDADLLRRNDLERYEIVLVPGSIKREGVLPRR